MCFYPILWAAEVSDSFDHDRFFMTRTRCRASYLMISFIYSVVYIFLNTICINVEFFILTADGLRRFFQNQFDDCCCKEDVYKGQRIRELAEEKKVRSRDVSQREDSEGLRSTGSQKYQRIIEQNR